MTTSFRAKDCATVPRAPCRRAASSGRSSRSSRPASASVDRRQHVLRHDVGEEAQPAAVDAEQRHGVARHQARGVQQRAIAADGDDEVGAFRDLALGHALHRLQHRVELGILGHQHRDAALAQVRQERAEALRDARIGESAH